MQNFVVAQLANYALSVKKDLTPNVGKPKLESVKPYGFEQSSGRSFFCQESEAASDMGKKDAYEIIQ